MLRIDQSGSTLTDSDIRECESKLCVRLPDEYRRFLLQYNGGVPFPDIVDIAGASQSPTDVQIFFGVTRTIASSNICWNAQIFMDRLPDGLLPIACDSGGNLFCLQHSGNGIGSVVYVDFEQDPPRSYFVASAFNGFLTRIRQFERSGAEGVS